MTIRDMKIDSVTVTRTTVKCERGWCTAKASFGVRANNWAFSRKYCKTHLPFKAIHFVNSLGKVN